MEKDRNVLQQHLRAGDIPELMKMILNEALDYGLRKDAMIGLGKLGAPASAALLGLLKHPFPGLRQAALEALVQVAVPTPEQLAALAAVLEDEDSAVRRVLVIGLGNLGPSTVPLLEQALEDGSEDVCAHAVIALAKNLPHSEAVLRRSLEHRSKTVRKYAAHALQLEESEIEGGANPDKKNPGGSFEQMRQEARRSIKNRKIDPKAKGRMKNPWNPLDEA
jgi:hypothetical protein